MDHALTWGCSGIPSDHEHWYRPCTDLEYDAEVEDGDGSDQRQATTKVVTHGRSEQGAQDGSSTEDSNDDASLARRDGKMAAGIPVSGREGVFERVHGEDSINGPIASRQHASHETAPDTFQEGGRLSSPRIISEQ